MSKTSERGYGEISHPRGSLRRHRNDAHQVTANNRITLSRQSDDCTVPVAIDDALEVLLRFGTAPLRADDTATRVRECMGALARAMGTVTGGMAVGLAVARFLTEQWRGAER
jgi:hypothetical protein